MKWTAKQKAAIKGYYPQYRLRFMVDGSVQAQQRRGGPSSEPRSALSEMHPVVKTANRHASSAEVVALKPIQGEKYPARVATGRFDTPVILQTQKVNGLSAVDLL